MREIITLACGECKRRNYVSTKDKRKHPDRIENSKFCKFCKRHTKHRESK